MTDAHQTTADVNAEWNEHAYESLVLESKTKDIVRVSTRYRGSMFVGNTNLH